MAGQTKIQSNKGSLKRTTNKNIAIQFDKFDKNH